MKLTEQLAVMDLMAAGDFVLMPEDDLTLATLLKSPLIGLDDDDLFDLAYSRPGPLWDALRSKAADSDRYMAALEHLTRWLARADTAPPIRVFRRFARGAANAHAARARRAAWRGCWGRH